MGLRILGTTWCAMACTKVERRWREDPLSHRVQGSNLGMPDFAWPYMGLDWRRRHIMCLADDDNFSELLVYKNTTMEPTP